MMQQSCLYFRQEEKYQNLLIESQIEFLRILKLRINATENREDLIDMMYRLRYYLLLPVNKDKQIYQIIELQKEICDVINLLVDKCIDKKIITNFSNSVSLCYNVLKYVFITQIMNLENISIEIRKEKEIIIDEEDSTKEYHITISLYDEKEKTEEHKCVVENLSLLNNMGLCPIPHQRAPPSGLLQGELVPLDPQFFL